MIAMIDCITNEQIIIKIIKVDTLSPSTTLYKEDTSLTCFIHIPFRRRSLRGSDH